MLPFTCHVGNESLDVLYSQNKHVGNRSVYTHLSPTFDLHISNHTFSFSHTHIDIYRPRSDLNIYSTWFLNRIYIPIAISYSHFLQLNTVDLHII